MSVGGGGGGLSVYPDYVVKVIFFPSEDSSLVGCAECTSGKKRQPKRLGSVGVALSSWSSTGLAELVAWGKKPEC